jgi:hypothetical protein
MRNGCFDASASADHALGGAGSFTVANMSGALMMVGGTACAICAALLFGKHDLASLFACDPISLSARAANVTLHRFVLHVTLYRFLQLSPGAR